MYLPEQLSWLKHSVHTRKTSGSSPLSGTNRRNAYFISFQRLGQSLYKNLPIYPGVLAVVASRPHKPKVAVFESRLRNHKKAHTAIFFKKGNQSNGRTQIFGDLQNRFESGIIFLKVPCICYKIDLLDKVFQFYLYIFYILLKEKK